MQMIAMTIFVSIFITIMLTGMSGGAGSTSAINVDAATHTPQIGETAKPMQPMETTALPTEMATTTPVLTEMPKSYIYYDVPLDDDFQEYIQDICEQYGFDRYDIVIALIEKESSYREKVISKTADYGYMQINTINHEWLSEELGITDFLDGEQNVLAGVHMLSKLYKKYEDIGLALMAYNCGETGARRLLDDGIYSTSYSRAIQENAEKLEVRK